MGETATTVRLPDEMIVRLDAMAKILEGDPEVVALSGGQVSRSKVLRLALLRGLDALETQYADAPKKRRTLKAATSGKTAGKARIAAPGGRQEGRRRS